MKYFISQEESQKKHLILVFLNMKAQSINIGEGLGKMW